jgi:hypothetical protein
MPRARIEVKRHAVAQPSDPSYRLIPLTQGKNTIVDAADYEWLMQWPWFAQKDAWTGKFYARHRFHHGGRVISMQSFILECGPGELGDHKNGDTLDNRRNNIRKASHSQNSRNRQIEKRNKSGYKGVRFEYKSWRARIRVADILFHLGQFPTPEEAAIAYDEAAIKHFAEFASLNFPKH